MEIKRGKGRPKKQAAERLQTLTARLRPELVRKIESIASARGCTRSAVVQELLASAVRRAK